MDLRVRGQPGLQREFQNGQVYREKGGGGVEKEKKRKVSINCNGNRIIAPLNSTERLSPKTATDAIRALCGRDSKLRL